MRHTRLERNFRGSVPRRGSRARAPEIMMNTGTDQRHAESMTFATHQSGP
ncbi:Uncharacterised protein [Mycobacteroides abscessus subsp. abscessus]|nr:Uncharacterised protein [Mycobacteroides abscessus subsp. abscessus]